MGDRGNIKVGGVYLYTHWCGSQIKTILKKALKRKLRLKDEAYLTRIIFCEMLKAGQESLDGETGFGISISIQDNEHNILEVDCKNQKISELKQDFENKTDKRKVLHEWTFKQFIGVKNDTKN